jgi:hypothetical protein
MYSPRTPKLMSCTAPMKSTITIRLVRPRGRKWIRAIASINTQQTGDRDTTAAKMPRCVISRNG